MKKCKCYTYKEMGEDALETLKIIKVPIATCGGIKTTVQIDIDLSTKETKKGFIPTLNAYVDYGYASNDVLDRKLLGVYQIPIKYCPFCGEKIVIEED